MFISAVIWGTVADKYGRRPTIILTSVFLCYFGFLVSFSFRRQFSLGVMEAAISFFTNSQYLYIDTQKEEASKNLLKKYNKMQKEDSLLDFLTT
jgi:hypothetical protein